ncbi:MAG: hypothetical protein WCT77_02975 [Bacteroidota bacterium]|jgi:hypothetical protein
MTYNTCKICGANNGRAGILIGNPAKNLLDACLNCHDTRTQGIVIIHADLIRTEAEIKKTIEIISIPLGITDTVL